MPKQSRDQKSKALALSDAARQAIRKSNQNPGFDYAKTILELKPRYTYDQIGEFCGYTKSYIAKIASGKNVPSHPAGEALYILYVEAFKKKPPDIPYKFPIGNE